MLHQVGVSFDLYYDARKHKIKKKCASLLGVTVVTTLYNKEFLCITRTVEHSYILPSSTVRLQLNVSALYVGHLQVEI